MAGIGKTPAIKKLLLIYKPVATIELLVFHRVRIER